MSIRRFIKNPQFGGFGERLVANFLDFLIVFSTVIIIMKMLGLSADNAMRLATGVKVTNELSKLETIIYIMTLAYYLIMPATPFRGTFGKMIMNLQIVTEQGKRISIVRSLWRYIASFVSAILLFFGFILIIFHSEKRGLHDLMANTYVLKKNRL
jgi:uncharacterized RDD family membrane protein YckC